MDRIIKTKKRNSDALISQSKLLSSFHGDDLLCELTDNRKKLGSTIHDSFRELSDQSQSFDVMLQPTSGIFS